jgi:hypothetical protein
MGSRRPAPPACDYPSSIDFEQYMRFQPHDKQELLDIIRAIHERNRDADADEVEAEIAMAVAEVRQSVSNSQPAGAPRRRMRERSP